MAHALALAVTPISLPGREWLRRGVVCGCALALICAGQALPAL